ncbi:hypothetical protein FQR65_LT07284 [Abscondita terminalis]|nr:hypothetical protein FQR65_LT07284 [Abscondita terminalis]
MFKYLLLLAALFAVSMADAGAEAEAKPQYFAGYPYHGGYGHYYKSVYPHGYSGYYGSKLLLLAALFAVSMADAGAEAEAKPQYFAGYPYHGGYGHYYKNVYPHGYSGYYGSKLLLVVAFFAVSMAAPEPEPAPQNYAAYPYNLGYSNLGYGNLGFGDYYRFYRYKQPQPQVYPAYQPHNRYY